MKVREFDFEKDILVFYKTLSGDFIRYQWNPFIPPDELQEKLDRRDKDKTGEAVEIITDKLLRDICAYAYKRYAGAMRSSADEAEEVMESINDAREWLQNALDDLDRISGLE
jgi:hypothetical protein